MSHRGPRIGKHLAQKYYDIRKFQYNIVQSPNSAHQVKRRFSTEPKHTRFTGKNAPVAAFWRLSAPESKRIIRQRLSAALAHSHVLMLCGESATVIFHRVFNLFLALQLFWSEFHLISYSRHSFCSLFPQTTSDKTSVNKMSPSCPMTTSDKTSVNKMSPSCPRQRPTKPV